MNEDLKLLLQLSDLEFWKTVKTHPSLNDALDAFLRFRRRIFDSDDVPNSSTFETLSKRVFFVFMRL